jgi:hypothetical protein
LGVFFLGRRHFLGDLKTTEAFLKEREAFFGGQNSKTRKKVSASTHLPRPYPYNIKFLPIPPYHYKTTKFKKTSSKNSEHIF